jgi:ribosomal-protein-alanine N-acetyltransferase
MIANLRELGPLIRDMRQADVAQVATIERAAYEFPWSPGIFRDCLLAGYTSIVIEDKGRVIGYAIMSVAAGEAHLLNLCVAADVRRTGHGRRLLAAVVHRARNAGAERMHLEVRPSNTAALALYAGTGFERIGLRRAYYRARSGSEDAVLLARWLGRRSRP